MIFLYLLLTISLTAATPLKRINDTGDNSDQHVVGYTSDPPGRGTLTLIISCLLTLVLCVWSALHLNVPPPGRKHRQTIWTNVLWITAGIYAPELVVFTAWRQWSSARMLSQIIDECSQSQKKGEEAHTARHQWTMTHSFFATTGGFAIDCNPYIANPSVGGNFLPKNTPKRLTVTAKGMEFLVRRGTVPNIPREDIKDKSKADALAKTLVLVQACWMMLQVMGRLLAHLPVTLLEVNTVAHVFCALAMSSMWWHKPLLANEPFLIVSDRLPHLLPFMYMCSEVSGRVDPKQLQSQTIVKTLFAYLNLYSKVPEIEYICHRPVQKQSSGVLDENAIRLRTVESAPQSEIPEYECSIVGLDCKAPMRQFSMGIDGSTAFFERRPRVRIDTSKHFKGNTTADLRREQLGDLLRRETLSSMQSFSHPVSEGKKCTHFRTEQLLVEYSRNWPSDELLRSVDGLVVGMVLWLANFLYGGIHAAAWNDHFPSTAEKWLWRSSAVYIGFCGGLWVILNFTVMKHRPLNEFWEKWMDGEKGWFGSLTLGALVIICGFSLMLARAYIVIEAFVSIRQLPSSAYETPSWSQIFPHF